MKKNIPTFEGYGKLVNEAISSGNTKKITDLVDSLVRELQSQSVSGKEKSTLVVPRFGNHKVHNSFKQRHTSMLSVTSRMAGKLLNMTNKLKEQVDFYTQEAEDGDPVFFEETLGILFDLLERGNAMGSLLNDLSIMPVKEVRPSMSTMRLDRPDGSLGGWVAYARIYIIDGGNGIDMDLIIQYLKSRYPNIPIVQDSFTYNYNSSLEKSIYVERPSRPGDSAYVYITINNKK